MLVEQQSLQNLAAAKVVQIIMFRFGLKLQNTKLIVKPKALTSKLSFCGLSTLPLYFEMESAELLEVKNTHMHNHN